MVVRQSASLIALGLAAGQAMARVLSSQLFGVTPTDPLAYWV